DGKSDLGSARTQADRAKSSGIRVISIGVPTPSNGDLTVAADVLTAIASSASTYLATDGPDQIASRLLQVATDSCSLTRPDRPLNGTVYANDQRPQTVCDTFTVKEDSADNILDILANDNLPSNITLADLEIFVTDSQGVIRHLEQERRVVGANGTFEATTIQNKPLLRFTPRPDFFTPEDFPGIRGSYQRFGQPETSVAFTVYVAGTDDPPVA